MPSKHYMRYLRPPKLSFTPGFWVVLAGAVLFVPFPWLIAWFVAAGIHEIMHITALMILKVHISTVTLGSTGAVIRSDQCSLLKRIICTVAGPFGGLLLLTAVHITPRLALCGLIQSLYNLLPIFDLDGKNILVCLLMLMVDERAASRIVSWIEAITIGLIIGCIIYISIFGELGMIGCLCIVAVVLKYKKYLAKS